MIMLNTTMKSRSFSARGHTLSSANLWVSLDEWICRRASSLLTRRISIMEKAKKSSNMSRLARERICALMKRSRSSATFQRSTSVAWNYNSRKQLPNQDAHTCRINRVRLWCMTSEITPLQRFETLKTSMASGSALEYVRIMLRVPL